MSTEQIKENKNVSVLVTHKEYRNISNLALRAGESLMHFYERGGVKVVIALSFLIEYDMLDLIEF